MRWPHGCLLSAAGEGTEAARQCAVLEMHDNESEVPRINKCVCVLGSKEEHWLEQGTEQNG
eukprot:1162128-Pelagomonas_calceolata.AAC.8